MPILIVALLLALTQPSVRPVVFAADDKPGTIGGLVAVESGNSTKPVANAEVRVTFGSKTDVRRTGADGKYTFGDVLPGKYTVKVTPPDGTKLKGDGTQTVTINGGDTERVDFVLLPLPTPSPTPKATATPAANATPSAKSSPGTTSVVVAPTMVSVPAVVVPYPSPPTANQQPSQQASGQSAPPSNQPVAIVNPYGTPSAPGVNRVGPIAVPPSVGGQQPGAIVVASPRALPISPGLTFAISSPQPIVGPSVARTPSPEDVVAASAPPRRLITSFAALRETGGGSLAQLRSWANDTSLVLGVPFRTQIDGTSFSLVNCGPASLAMVLTAFGLDIDPPSVRDYLNHLVGNYDTESGTSLYVLARIAQEAGLHTFGTASGLQGWTIDAVREQVRAGHPVITLTKYRRLPGHFGSVTEFDHYIVITGLAGDDFVYNDAAYSTEYGYNLLISPAQLQRAWADSSVPRHAVAIGFGDSLRPLPIVPNRLTAESLASTGDDFNIDDVQAIPETPIHVNRGPAAEWLREQTLDLLGARTARVNGEPSSVVASLAPRTRLDPGDLGRQERPSGLAVGDGRDTGLSRVAASDAEQSASLDPNADPAAVADVRGAATEAGADGQLIRPIRGRSDAPGGWLSLPLATMGLGLMGLGVILTLTGGVAGWRRGEQPVWLARLATVRVSASQARATAVQLTTRRVAASREWSGRWSGQALARIRALRK